MNFLFGFDGKKGDLLKAGLELFAARGYDGVSVRDIAKAAGVSEAALYKHFAGKEEMALYLFTEVISEYTRRIAEIGRQEISPVDKLCRIVEITYSLYDSYPVEIHFALLSGYGFEERAPDSVKPHNVFRSILAEGMASGQIKLPEATFGVAIFSGLMLQPLARYLSLREDLPPLPELGKMVAAVVRKTFA